MALWGAWVLLGSALLPAAAVAFRLERGPLAAARVAAALGVVVLLGGLVVALLIRGSAP